MLKSEAVRLPIFVPSGVGHYSRDCRREHDRLLPEKDKAVGKAHTYFKFPCTFPIWNTKSISILKDWNYLEWLTYYFSPTSKMCSILYFLMAYIALCNIYRTIQIIVTPFSTLWKSEVYFWVFEALMTLAYTISFHVFHPATYLTAMCESQQ